jgi:hypothetical protein
MIDSDDAIRLGLYAPISILFLFAPFIEKWLEKKGILKSGIGLEDKK